MSAVVLPRLYVEAEVAEMLGLSVSSVRAARKRGQLRGRTPRGMSRPWLYTIRDIAEWVGVPEEELE